MLLEDGGTRTRRCKTFKCSEMLLEDGEAGRWRNVTSLVASTQHHRAHLLKYYPGQPFAPSFVKSRMLRSLQTYFLLFQQIFFILVCIHAGNPRVPPRVLASEPKPCGGNKSLGIRMRLTFLSRPPTEGMRGWSTKKTDPHTRANDVKCSEVFRTTPYSIFQNSKNHAKCFWFFSRLTVIFLSFSCATVNFSWRWLTVKPIVTLI